MREAELLYVIAVLLFLYESVITVPLDAAVVQQRAWGWRAVAPFVLRSGAGPAVVFAWPLPLLGRLAIGKRKGRLALAEVAPRLGAHRKIMRELKLATNLLFFSIFGGGAALVWLGHAVPDLPVLTAMGGSWVTTVIAGVFAQRDLAKELRPAWKDVIVAMLSPISAMRLPEILSKKVVADIDGLALIGALVPPAERVEPFRRALARATYCGDGDAVAIAALAVEAGLDVERLRTPPERESESALAYCPVCQAQFLRTDATCESCGDLVPTPYP